MKSYTDLEQGKKLAEFLPHDSADMYYQYVLPKSDKIKHIPEIGKPTEALEWYNKGYTHFGKEPLSLKEYCVPCWSLAALLSIIRETTGYTLYGVNNVYMSCGIGDKPWKLEIGVYDNEVDACYEMILKLHDNNLL